MGVGDRPGQQAPDREDVEGREAPLFRQADGVGDGDLLDRRLGQPLDRRA